MMQGCSRAYAIYRITARIVLIIYNSDEQIFQLEIDRNSCATQFGAVAKQQQSEENDAGGWRKMEREEPILWCDMVNSSIDENMRGQPQVMC